MCSSDLLVGLGAVAAGGLYLMTRPRQLPQSDRIDTSPQPNQILGWGKWTAMDNRTPYAGPPGANPGPDWSPYQGRPQWAELSRIGWVMEQNGFLVRVSPSVSCAGATPVWFDYSEVYLARWGIDIESIPVDLYGQQYSIIRFRHGGASITVPSGSVAVLTALPAQHCRDLML